MLEGDPPSRGDIRAGCRFRARCPSALATCADVDPALKADGDRAVACHNPAAGIDEP
jgi:oligopeptide/dipeptide ABC transporter ATP-binding protein